MRRQLWHLPLLQRSSAAPKPRPGSRGCATLRPLAPLCRRSGDLAPLYFVSNVSVRGRRFLMNCGGQNHLDVARNAYLALEREEICVRTRGNRARGDSAPRSASRAQKVLNRVVNSMKFDRGPRSKVPEKVGLRLAGIADRVVAHTEGAPRGSFVQSGTSQEPHKPTTGEVVAHTQLSPLEVPSRPPRRLRAKLPTLSRMGATADWRSQVKNDAPRQARERHWRLSRRNFGVSGFCPHFTHRNQNFL